MKTMGIIVYGVGIGMYFYDRIVVAETVPSAYEIALFVMIAGVFNVALAKKDK